jgi:hypothetical protein
MREIMRTRKLRIKVWKMLNIFGAGANENVRWPEHASQHFIGADIRDKTIHDLVPMKPMMRQGRTREEACKCREEA